MLAVFTAHPLYDRKVRGVGGIGCLGWGGEDGIRENIKRGESNEMMGTMIGKSWEEGEQRKR